jgi:hypothetical protein
LGTVNWIKRDGNPRALDQARVNLFRAKDEQVFDSTLSDHHGRFEFHPPPGHYELTISRQGFQEAKGKEFLVPGENLTQVKISTMRIGMVVLCQ